MAVIKKQSLVDQVYEKLRGDIISLQIPLGSKVNVNELQEILGVSSTPIREAVNRLQQEGLVVYENNVGAHVLTLDEHDVIEIQQISLMMHSEAIRLAIAGDEQEELLNNLLKMITALKEAKTAKSKLAATIEIFGSYYHHCGNRRLDGHMIAFQGEQWLIRNLYAQYEKDTAEDIAYFERMYEGTVQRDTEAVIGVLKEYTEKMNKAILQHFADEK